MNRVIALLVRDILGVGFGVLFALAVVVLALDGVEVLNTVDGGSLDILSWLLSELPGVLLGVLPVVVGVSAATVIWWWQRDGRLVGLQAVGVSPVRLVCWVGFAGALLSGTVLAAHEVVSLASPVTATAVGEWVRIDGVERHGYMLVDDSVGAQLFNVRFVEFDGDQMIAQYSVDSLMPTPNGWRGDQGGDLHHFPTVQEWQSASVRLSSREPLWRVLGAAPTRARSALLVERMMMPLLAALLGVLAGAMTLLWPRQSFVLVVLMSGGAQLTFRTVMNAAGRGEWPLLAACVVALLPLLLGSLSLLYRLSRGR